MMLQYVVGLAYTTDRESLLLIQKARPEWQAGYLNGVGGLIEGNEDIQAAMVREFEEETGIATRVEQWSHFLTLTGENYRVFFLFTMTDDVRSAKNMTDEPLHLVPVVGISHMQVLRDLQWIIPLSLFHTRVKIPVEITTR